MKRTYIILSVILSGSLNIHAQTDEKWTLEDCISYALEKNISLQQDKLQRDNSEVDLKTAKAALFPSLSFSTGHNLVNKPYKEKSAIVNGSDIIETSSSTTYNGSYNLRAQWTLWNGGQRLNNIKEKEASLQKSQLTVSETQNMLMEEITKLFVQILYAYESVSINRNTLEVSKATLSRAQELYHEGSLSKVDLSQLKSQVSNDEFQLVSAESALQNYKLRLKQMLEIDGTYNLDLEIPVFDDDDVMELIPNYLDVYHTALSSRPEIQNSKLDIDISKLNMKTAKAGYLPTVSMSASVSSMTNSTSTAHWADQMKNGMNEAIGLSVNIPIFNNRQTKSAIEKAQISHQNSQLNMINAQKNLYATVEGLWLDAVNAQKQFETAKSKFQSCQVSFDLVSQQFSLGMKNTIELLTEKTNLLSARQQMVQSKYMAILNKTLLKFISDGEMTLEQIK